MRGQIISALKPILALKADDLVVTPHPTKKTIHILIKKKLSEVARGNLEDILVNGALRIEGRRIIIEVLGGDIVGEIGP